MLLYVIMAPGYVYLFFILSSGFYNLSIIKIWFNENCLCLESPFAIFQSLLALECRIVFWGLFLKLSIGRTLTSIDLNVYAL